MNGKRFLFSKSKEGSNEKGEERKEREMDRTCSPPLSDDRICIFRWGRDNLLLIPKKIAWKIGETLAPCFLYQRPPA